MENTMMVRFKESIARHRQNLIDWLRGATPYEQKIRMGPLGEDGVRKHIQLLDNALEKAENNTLGICTVCHEFVETNRLEMDYTASVCIDHLTGEERTSLENELELSQKVQRALLPHEVPSVRGLEIAAFSQPARIVGGDYFDFTRTADGSHAIVIADVMGKGMPASMLMASLQASLRIIAPERKHPSEIVRRLNDLFSHNIQLTKFVTLFFGRYDEQTRVLTYVNAGHNPPLIARSNGRIEWLRPTGAAIGLVEDTKFAESDVVLKEGDSLLLYTDGVVEARNADGQLFSEERLEVFSREHADHQPSRLIASLREELQKFSGSNIPSDDTTILAVRAIR